MKTPSRTKRSLLTGLAGAGGAVIGGATGLYAVALFIEPLGPDESFIDAMFRMIPLLLVAGLALAAGTLIGWLIIPPVMRALLGWTKKGKSLGLQLLAGVLMWPGLVWMISSMSDRSTGEILWWALLVVFLTTAVAEAVAVGSD